ncbi:MAG TPA: GNAT family N-acetyltransferase [Chitinophagaceae bacterium]|jgi:predicted GNAT family acetyltransferase|nr:GNAT family N-acetyltransferase [Chitinophagaceae bacterium]
MEIQNKKVGTKGMFYIEQDGDIVAKMVYSMPAPEKMIVEHTEVDDSLRGKNVGMQLFHHMVEYARANNIKVIPLCPFTNAMFKKKPEYSDVLDKN